MSKLSAKECVKRWGAGLREDRAKLYKQDERKKHLKTLMQYFKTNDISHFQANAVQKEVIDVLVTKEGQKGKEKYATWKPNAIQDFEDAVQIAYVDGVSEEAEQQAQPMKKSWNYTVMPDIMAWLKYKYGPNVKQAIIDAAHTPGHEIRYKFYEEVFGVK